MNSVLLFFFIFWIGFLEGTDLWVEWGDWSHEECLKMTKKIASCDNIQENLETSLAQLALSMSQSTETEVYVFTQNARKEPFFSRGRLLVKQVISEILENNYRKPDEIQPVIAQKLSQWALDVCLGNERQNQFPNFDPSQFHMDDEL